MDSEDLFGSVATIVEDRSQEQPEVVMPEVEVAVPEPKKVKMKLKKWPAQSLERMSEFFESEKHCDVFLRFPAGEERIAVHSLVLMASSDFFVPDAIGEKKKNLIQIFNFNIFVSFFRNDGGG